MAYVDESGDTGSVAKEGASSTYSLGCLLVEADDWPDAFEEMLEFRRRLKKKFGVPIRAEVKANYLTGNKGDLRPLALGPGARKTIYRAHLRMVDQMPARAFAVIVDKRTRTLSADDCFGLAWEGLLNRLERTSTKEKQPLSIYHDEGEDARFARPPARLGVT